jgi:HEAT repeat protein
VHRKRLQDQEIQALADVMFAGQEEWLAEKLRWREDQGLVLEFLGCLGRSGSGRAVGLLLKCLEEREESIQLAAAAALKGCPPEGLLEALGKIMVRQNQASAKAGEVIAAFGNNGRDVLWRLWFVPEAGAGLKAQILQLLTEAQDARSEALVYLALNSREEELLRAGLRGAERNRSRKLWGNVAGCLSHASWRVRGRAAAVLGELGEQLALPFLEKMAADEDEWVEEERKKAIALLRTGG